MGTSDFYSAYEGKSDIIRILLHNGANPNNVDIHNETILMHAVNNGDELSVSVIACSVSNKNQTNKRIKPH